ncbi:DivIVA domain-containing protein [Arthrobacter sp. AK04]|jgi:DivIVA domain-containing protein|uniref:DivIVA domain-containing protein n=1 Tax=Arthrobacter sp. AK04 TaxID=2900048 RepID=UPI001E43CE7F|nr:DivIVA domain-containing protein [Arthrobacter sp. AK04]MCD5343411.1 DivIVA domain-containing protein [Arthrobacter sp. AK04]
MALTPEDVVNKRFQPTKFREGYDQDEVDDFLDEIVVELRRLNQENDELRKKLAEAGSSVPASSAAAPVVEKVPAPVKADKDEAREKAEAEAKAAEASKKKDVQPAAAAAPAASAPAVATPSAESAAGLLAMAQQMHDRHVADGQAQKDKIIAEAQIEASSLVNDAQEKSRKILGALEQQRSVLERKVEQLRGFERDYRSRLKAYIEGQLRDLDARGSVATPEVSEAN